MFLYVYFYHLYIAVCLFFSFSLFLLPFTLYMSYKHQSKGSTSTNYPLPSLCQTYSSTSSSTISLSIRNDYIEPTLVTDEPILLSTESQVRKWDDSQFALELAEDDISELQNTPKGKIGRIRSKVLCSLKKWQHKILN